MFYQQGCLVLAHNDLGIQLLSQPLESFEPAGAARQHEPAIRCEQRLTLRAGRVHAQCRDAPMACAHALRRSRRMLL